MRRKLSLPAITWLRKILLVKMALRLGKSQNLNLSSVAEWKIFADLMRRKGAAVTILVGE